MYQDTGRAATERPACGRTRQAMKHAYSAREIKPSALPGQPRPAGAAKGAMP
jgi:hypothetical protein